MEHNDPKVSHSPRRPSYGVKQYGTPWDRFPGRPFPEPASAVYCPSIGPLAQDHVAASWLPLYRIASGSASVSPRAYKVRSTMKSTMSETDCGFR